jgi:hypothetical protein
MKKPNLPASSKMKMPMAAAKPAIKKGMKASPKAAGAKSVKATIKKK